MRRSVAPEQFRSDGMVDRYTGNVNSNKIGLSLTVFARVKTQDADTIAHFVKGTQARTVVGRCDAVLCIVAADIEDLVSMGEE